MEYSHPAVGSLFDSKFLCQYKHETAKNGTAFD